MACFGIFKSLRLRAAGDSPEERKAAAAASSSDRHLISSSAFTGTTATTAASISGKNSMASAASSSSSSQRGVLELFEERAHRLRAFELHELREVTGNFAQQNKIGRGGFGTVYKGFLPPPNGRAGRNIPVAVKKLNQKGLQGHKQWLAEVQFLAVFEHPNLVKLLGYCAADTDRGIERLLVYEFMPNKSLEDHLFNTPSLPWNLRLHIALGAAQGLAYLHDGEVQVRSRFIVNRVEILRVIYRDFKTSNVLLDREFRPKLSDFGLAREGPLEGQTHVSTAVVGTYGYAAPDYIETGHLTTKSDVWSFGVVLFEILTGRRSLEQKRLPNEQKLLEWVKEFPVETRKFSMIMDPKLRGNFSLDAAREVATLANRCVLKNPKERPTMIEVMECLKRAIQMEPKEELAFTENSNKSRTSAVSTRR